MKTPELDTELMQSLSPIQRRGLVKLLRLSQYKERERTHGMVPASVVGMTKTMQALAAKGLVEEGGFISMTTLDMHLGYLSLSKQGRLIAEAVRAKRKE